MFIMPRAVYEGILASAIKPDVAPSELSAVVYVIRRAGLPAQEMYEDAKATAKKVRGIEIPAFHELPPVPPFHDPGSHDPAFRDLPPVPANAAPTTVKRPTT
jgi:hypothetical protein